MMVIAVNYSIDIMTRILRCQNVGSDIEKEIIVFIELL